MRKIKDYIIHLLGGITQEENAENQINCHELGEYIAYWRIKTFMDRINGTPADDWCKQSYGFVAERIKQIEEEDAKDEQPT